MRKNALEKLPENGDDVRCVIFLADAEKSGLVMHGYGEGNDIEAVADVFLHLQAIFRANGKDLSFVPVRKG